MVVIVGVQADRLILDGDDGVAVAAAADAKDIEGRVGILRDELVSTVATVQFHDDCFFPCSGVGIIIEANGHRRTVCRREELTNLAGVVASGLRDAILLTEDLALLTSTGKDLVLVDNVVAGHLDIRTGDRFTFTVEERTLTAFIH